MLRNRIALRGSPVLTIVLVLLAFSISPAQTPGPPLCSFSGLNPFSGLKGVIEEEMPGSTNPCTPFMWLPCLRAETRLRLLFINMLEGTYTDDNAAFSVGFTDDLGYVDQGDLLEFMVRMSVGRISGRFHYDAWFRTFRGNGSRLHWPELRLGMDVDVIRNKSMTLGANMDFNPQRVTFSVSHPSYGPRYFEWPRVVTAGIHAAYTPRGLWMVSPNLEFRYRFPIRTGTQVTECEMSAGFQTPETVLGMWSVKGGWRYSRYKYESGGISVDTKWSSVFAQLSFYY